MGEDWLGSADCPHPHSMTTSSAPKADNPAMRPEPRFTLHHPLPFGNLTHRG